MAVLTLALILTVPITAVISLAPPGSPERRDLFALVVGGGAVLLAIPLAVVVGITTARVRAREQERNAATVEAPDAG
jgi:hypothetical protein